MQDNRWLYFVVGGLRVVAVAFGVFYYQRSAPSGSTQVQTTTQPAPAGSGSSGAAAGSSSGGSSTSVTIEKKN